MTLKTTYLNTTKTCYSVEHNNVILYYSYKTPIVIYSKRQNKAVQTAKKYSLTTSKQITCYINKVLPVVAEVIEHEQFSDILRDALNF